MDSVRHDKFLRRVLKIFDVEVYDPRKGEVEDIIREIWDAGYKACERNTSNLSHDPWEQNKGAE